MHSGFDYRYPDSCLIQFAKAPELGKVKTRMHPALGAERATELHRQLVTHCHGRLTESGLASVHCKVAGDNLDFFEQLPVSSGRYVELSQQQGADLGERMYRAAADALEHYQAVVIVGSDCPFIDDAYLEQALAELHAGRDLVLGPANDGGYVLIGMRRVDWALFDGVAWGSGQVLSATRSRLAELQWDWFELPALSDIDRPDDLSLLKPFQWGKEWA